MQVALPYVSFNRKSLPAVWLLSEWTVCALQHLPVEQHRRATASYIWEGKDGITKCAERPRGRCCFFVQQNAMDINSFLSCFAPQRRTIWGSTHCKKVSTRHEIFGIFARINRIATSIFHSQQIWQNCMRSQNSGGADLPFKMVEWAKRVPTDLDLRNAKCYTWKRAPCVGTGWRLCRKGSCGPGRKEVNLNQQQALAAMRKYQK